MTREYEFRVLCAPSPVLKAAFPELRMVHLTDSITLMTGQVRDQAELLGVLSRFADLGIVVSEMRPLH